MWHRFSKKERKRLPVGSGFAAHLFMEFAAHWWEVGSTAPEWSLQQCPLYNYLKQKNIADDIHSEFMFIKREYYWKIAIQTPEIGFIGKYNQLEVQWAVLQHCTQITPTIEKVLSLCTNIPQHSGETNWLICAVYNYRRYTNVCVWVRLAFASLAFMPLHGRLPSS